MITFGLHTGCIGGIFITGTGIPGGLGPDACGRVLSADVKFVNPHTSASQARLSGNFIQ